MSKVQKAHGSVGPDPASNATRNRALLREVNEYITRVGAVVGDVTVDLLCECEDEFCIECVTVTFVRFEAMVDSGEPVLAPGHR